MFIIILAWVDFYLFIYFNIYISFIGFCHFIFSRNVPLYLYLQIYWYIGGSDGKESVCKVGDPGSIPGLGKCPGKGNSNPV